MTMLFIHLYTSAVSPSLGGSQQHRENIFHVVSEEFQYRGGIPSPLSPSLLVTFYDAQENTLALFFWCMPATTEHFYSFKLFSLSSMYALIKFIFDISLSFIHFFFYFLSLKVLKKVGKIELCYKILMAMHCSYLLIMSIQQKF